MLELIQTTQESITNLSTSTISAPKQNGSRNIRTNIYRCNHFMMSYSMPWHY
jgi:hypothetical protein